MKFLNIFEKLKLVFDMIIDSNTLIILVFMIIGTFILRLSNKINNKKMGIIIYLVELLAFGIILYFENTTLIPIGNDIIDNIFLNFYFPSIYVYLFIFVFTIVIFIYTLLNKVISKTYRTITNIYFFIFNFIFILFVNIIAKNNINIFAKESLFTNNNALVLLELSTLLFFLYLVVNIIVYFTNYVIVLVENKGTITNDNIVLEKTILDNTTSIEVDLEETDEVKELIPEPVVSFNELMSKIEFNDNIENKIEVNNIEKKIDLVPEFTKFIENNNSFNEQIDLVPEVNNGFRFIDPALFGNKNNTLKLEEDKKVKEKLNFIDFNIIDKPKEEKLTLKDYKLFSQMLKTVIENSGTPNLGITDILNINLLNKYSLEEYNKFEKILNSCMN